VSRSTAFGLPLLAALLLPSPGCAAVASSGHGHHEAFAACALDLQFASVPFLVFSHDAPAPWPLCLSPLCVPLALVDLPFSFVVDLALGAPAALRAVLEVPVGLPRSLGAD